MYSFPNLEPVCCSTSSSHCCFLTCIQMAQKAGKVAWYSHLLKNFPQFIKGFGIANKAEVDVFLELTCFFNDPVDVGNLISGSSAFSKSSLNICWIMEKQESSRKTSTSALLTNPKSLTVWITTNWKNLREMGRPDHITCLLRNLYAGQEATVRTGHGTTVWFQIGKEVHQGCILSPCLFNLHAEYIM